MANGIGYALDFERPLLELEKKIGELKRLSVSGSIDFTAEIGKLAKKAKRLLTCGDTPGAYPGIGAEERGQAEAIAINLEVMSGLRVPIISTVIGEGGSGGAMAIGVGNRVLMMENSIYSVISPESGSSILYRDASMAEKAADA